MGGNYLSGAQQSRRQPMAFRVIPGRKQSESRGAADIVAIRKNMTQPRSEVLNLFDIVLIQVKGGTARQPSEHDCRRLREVARLYRAKHVVQFQWSKGKSSEFFVLGRNLKWQATTSHAIFR